MAERKSLTSTIASRDVKACQYMAGMGADNWRRWRMTVEMHAADNS